ncbi:S1/P1 nuclease [Luteimonas sp. MJ293]|uniref:S1/P1 nuclease n=1 Tax=Luteimonas sp. MJ146 TaxID=3129240 RepID=UPI0031BBA5CE
MRTLLFAALLCVIAAPAPAHAWSARGHRLVGHVAESGLTPAARAEAERLLQGEQDAEKRSLAGIATWADELRGSDPVLGRRSAGWHYVNIGEDDCTYQADRHCPGGNCIVAAIDDQAAILGDQSRSDAERLQALKFVVHFVGDVHQPMHAGYAHDRGGNDVQLNLRDGTRNGYGTNLHALWDGGLFYNLRESEERHLRELGKLQVSVPPADAPATWAEESCRIAVDPSVAPQDTRVGMDYVYRWRPAAEERVVIAGQRLATLLNRLLDRGP